APDVTYAFPTRRSSDLGCSDRRSGYLQRPDHRPARSRVHAPSDRRRHDRRERAVYRAYADSPMTSVDTPHGGHDPVDAAAREDRSEEHTSELQSRVDLV